MAYKLIITEHAHKLLDNILQYLIYRLKSEQAAIHLMDGINSLYDRLEENPLQFPISKDAYLASKGYREAVVGNMNYTIVFSVKSNIVNIAGIFHQLENYQEKL